MRVLPDPAGAPLATGAAFAQKPDPYTMELAYPPEALRKGLGATVTAICQIQTDLSMICATVTTDPPGLTDFDGAVDKLAPRFLFKPNLKNGKPAAGNWIKVPFQFKLERD